MPAYRILYRLSVLFELINGTDFFKPENQTFLERNSSKMLSRFIISLESSALAV